MTQSPPKTTQDATALINRIAWAKVGDLVPAIIQDHTSGQVLMLGYMNRDAIEKTCATKQVTFYSRSRQCLWTKGETSGHTLTLANIALDCDKDTLLIQATPKGPTCHTGTISCWDNDTPAPPQPDMVWLNHLEHLLASRKGADPKTSYTASLYEKGTKRIAQKVGEEGVETALAATAGDREELKQESADLLYHLMVLLNQQNLSLKDVIQILKSRHIVN